MFQEKWQILDLKLSMLKINTKKRSRLLSRSFQLYEYANYLNPTASKIASLILGLAAAANAIDIVSPMIA